MRPFSTAGNNRMPTVRIKENEPFEVAMRRFKRTVEKTGKRHHKRLRSQLLPKKMY
jgi:small subunit ribosomal protein S21